MNALFKLLLVVYVMISGVAVGQESSCVEQCNAAFGTLVGNSFLTKAYSNCNGSCVKNENNYVSLNNSSKLIFTGMKWQCVEYARRWLIENKGVTFGDVQYAYNIWDLPSGETIANHERVPLQRFINKETKEAPQVGDLLINSVKLAITGHVSVVVGVEQDSITIAEQNYFNRPWEGKNYARRLLLDKDSQGRYRVFDDSLIGWVRIKT
jgi:glutathionylspermidine amidase/synthetase